MQQIQVVMLNGAFALSRKATRYANAFPQGSAMFAERSRRVASQKHTASRDSKAYGTLRERFAQNDRGIFTLIEMLPLPTLV